MIDQLVATPNVVRYRGAYITLYSSREYHLMRRIFHVNPRHYKRIFRGNLLVGVHLKIASNLNIGNKKTTSSIEGQMPHREEVAFSVITPHIVGKVHPN